MLPPVVRKILGPPRTAFATALDSGLCCRLGPKNRSSFVILRATREVNHMSLRSVTRTLAVGIATGAALLGVASVASAQNNGTVTGVVNDASGQPVAGAFVRLKNDQKRLTFMVISREQGRFDAKDLPPGTYRVQGVAGGHQSDWFSNVDVGAGGEAKVGLSLNKQRGPMLPPAWPQRIPQAQANVVSVDL